MTIKHLVLSGGGAGCFSIYGALKYLNNNNFFEFKNIKSIHACSGGAIITALILLEHNWELLDNYILKRPWDKIININSSSILNIWHKKGLFDENIIKEIIKPFLQANDLDINITLEELYNKIGIEIFIYTTNINSELLETIILSHITFPNLELYKAITMSCSFPIIFAPVCIDNNCYIDGGVLNNFPLNDCLNLNNDANEVLGIKVVSDNYKPAIQNDSILAQYLYNILSKIHSLICKDETIIDNLILCKIKNNSIFKWSHSITNVLVREEYINIGIEHAINFLSK